MLYRIKAALSSRFYSPRVYSINPVSFILFTSAHLQKHKGKRMLLKPERTCFLLICITWRRRAIFHMFCKPNKPHRRTAPTGGETTISNVIYLERNPTNWLFFCIIKVHVNTSNQITFIIWLSDYCGLTTHLYNWPILNEWMNKYIFS